MTSTEIKALAQAVGGQKKLAQLINKNQVQVSRWVHGRKLSKTSLSILQQVAVKVQRKQEREKQ